MADQRCPPHHQACGARHPSAVAPAPQLAPGDCLV
ncbi:hypothetical protein DUNSADRAFT_6814 [Dunaliella salina]|uniref:Uncharacterized protein n=1 Tax=Dunaliella salina TaxID=3046 RepID=A0ABQ7FTN9_DUNSA|nr:hypothetical protein DUNSADRAFT_6814 [Dunaliella salina]|eukprot:KAF5825810.1 hypothetical protein DUNSADRAFT_6814 [Dunaliella salina]